MLLREIGGIGDLVIGAVVNGMLEVKVRIGIINLLGIDNMQLVLIIIDKVCVHAVGIIVQDGAAQCHIVLEGKTRVGNIQIHPLIGVVEDFAEGDCQLVINGLACQLQ